MAIHDKAGAEDPEWRHCHVVPVALGPCDPGHAINLAGGSHASLLAHMRRKVQGGVRHGRRVLQERRTGITEHVLNLVATACKEAELLDEALR